MAKKKVSNQIIEEVKKSKNKDKEKGGIIVLNEGKVKEDDELDILGTLGETYSVTVDTSYLDEELGISDIFQENGIQLMQVGEKSKVQDVDFVEDAAEDDDELIQKIANVFSKVLKHKKFEPIPYPFKNKKEFDAAFTKAVELIDHIAIAKFSRKNPELNLRDAFMYVFTVNEDEATYKKAANGITTSEVVEADEILDSNDSDINNNDDADDNEDGDNNDDIYARRMMYILNSANEEITTIIEEVIKNGDKEPEEVLKVLLTQSHKLEDTKCGKLIKAVTGKSIADIIKEQINGNSQFEQELEKQLEEYLIKLNEAHDEIESMIGDENISDEDFMKKIFDIIGAVETKKEIKKYEEAVKYEAPVTLAQDSYVSSYQEFYAVRNRITAFASFMR